MRPSGVTAVASMVRSAAPESARWPRWITCQSVMQPSSAEYWHIGAITIRLARRRLPTSSGVNRADTGGQWRAVPLATSDLVPLAVHFAAADAATRGAFASRYKFRAIAPCTAALSSVIVAPLSRHDESAGCSATNALVSLLEPGSARTSFNATAGSDRATHSA